MLFLLPLLRMSRSNGNDASLSRMSPLDPGALADVVNELAGFLMAHAATAKRIGSTVPPVGQVGPTGAGLP